LTSLILDEERLRAERANRGSWKSRVTGLEEFGLGGDEPTNNRRKDRQRPQQDDEDDLEYKLALEASKNEAEMEAQRRNKSSVPDDADDDLAKAIRLSKEEEELRKRQLEDQNQGDLLFDDTPAQAPQPTGFNQGYQQQAAVDWFGNPVQQPQQTGYVENAYSQPLQQQQTAFQNGYGGGFGYQQPQPTGYEQMQQPQQQFIQQQNTYNPWAQQMNGFGQPQQQQPIQEQPTAQAGSNNPWASTQPTATPIGAQPTGSNNPFASHSQASRQTSSPFRQPTLNTLAEQKTATQFNTRPNPIQNFTTPQPTQSPVQQQAARPPQDPYQAKLNSLLSSGEGQDTFGNTGDMRIPAQHTAPGTYVNSAGLGSMGRLEASRTGTNPFFSQQPQQQFPAQTGPAGGFGMGGGNPFGAQQPRQQQQQQQGGSLIDL
jgi:epsin